jgi:hypothetical protein
VSRVRKLASIYGRIARTYWSWAPALLLLAGLADAVANIFLTPIFAIAAVLLTLDLIAAREGGAPRLNPSPEPALGPA